MTVNEALAAAIESAQRPLDTRSVMRLFTVMLLVAFFATLMLGLASGAHAYRVVDGMRVSTDELHLQSLLANIVRMNDVNSGLRRAQGPEGPALVLEQDLETGTYETRIYAYEGMVVQEYAMEGTEPDPAGATPLLASRTFDFDLDEGLLCVRTDEGQTTVALRSEQGGGL